MADVRFGLSELTGKIPPCEKAGFQQCSGHFDDSCFDMVGLEVSMSYVHVGISFSDLVARQWSEMFIERVRYDCIFGWPDSSMTCLWHYVSALFSGIDGKNTHYAL